MGAAESDLGVTGLSILGLQTQAVTRALADAGLTLADVDGLATTGVSRFSATQLADHLGLTPSWTDSTFAGGSAFEMYVARAAQAIEAGQCSTVVISFASNQRSARSRSLGGVVETHTPEAQFEAPYGALYPASYYAMAAGAYLHRTAPTREQLAEVAVAAREWALLNPAAFRHESGPLTVDDVLSAPMISTPLTAADCCLVTDGGGAVVLTSLERARDLARPPVVRARLRRGDHQHLDDGGRRPRGVRRRGASGEAAFKRAGLTVADVDVAQVYDSFTITVLLTLEALGFCGPGEAAARTSRTARPPAEHVRRRAVLLPPRPVRGAAPRRGGPPAARRVRAAPGRGCRGRARARHRRHPLHPRHGAAGGGQVITPAEPDEMTQTWWDATREGRLLVQSCEACGHRQHPPRAVCTACGSTEHLGARRGGRHGGRRRLHRGAARTGGRAHARRTPSPGSDWPRASSC